MKDIIQEGNYNSQASLGSVRTWGCTVVVVGGLWSRLVYRQRISPLVITRSIARACISGNQQQRAGRLEDDFLLLLILSATHHPWWEVFAMMMFKPSSWVIPISFKCSFMHASYPFPSLPLFEWFDTAVGHCCCFLRKQSIYMSRFGQHHIPSPPFIDAGEECCPRILPGTAPWLCFL